MRMVSVLTAHRSLLAAAWVLLFAWPTPGCIERYDHFRQGMDGGGKDIGPDRSVADGRGVEGKVDGGEPDRVLPDLGPGDLDVQDSVIPADMDGIGLPDALPDVKDAADADAVDVQDSADEEEPLSVKCGDGVCSSGFETCETCAADCGPCPGQCNPSCNAEEECVQATTGGWVCAAKMVEIPAGNFWMGCNNCAGSSVNDAECGSDEQPYHEVYLDAYEIDRTEVTAAQYLACKDAGKCVAAGSGSYATYNVPGKEDNPVNYVSWSQAGDYCLWAGKQLCTEAQWEKGARGGCEKNGGEANCKAQSRKYPWGKDAASCQFAVMDDGGGYGCGTDSTMSVCSKSPAGDSPYGLCDMAGNVWEWTADRYQKDYYCDGPAATGDQTCAVCGSWPDSPQAWSNPPGPGSGLARVRRGGCVFSGPGAGLRVSDRIYDVPSFESGFFVGLRCCRTE